MLTTRFFCVGDQHDDMPNTKRTGRTRWIPIKVGSAECRLGFVANANGNETLIAWIAIGHFTNGGVREGKVERVALGIERARLPSARAFALGMPTPVQAHMLVVDARKTNGATEPQGSFESTPLALGRKESVDRNAQRNATLTRLASRPKVNRTKAPPTALEHGLELGCRYFYLNAHLELRSSIRKVGTYTFRFDELLEHNRHEVISN